MSLLETIYQLYSELKNKLLKVEGHVPQCPIAGDANSLLCVDFIVSFIPEIRSISKFTCRSDQGSLKVVEMASFSKEDVSSYNHVNIGLLEVLGTI